MIERDTTQRRAIRQVFREADRPLSTQDVLEAAAKYHANIGIATVYRTIKILLESRWLTTVRMAGEPPRYEMADKPHHHHFFCNRCGRAYEFPGNDRLLAQMVPPGFLLETHDFSMRGVCAHCAPKTR